MAGAVQGVVPASQSSFPLTLPVTLVPLAACSGQPTTEVKPRNPPEGRGRTGLSFTDFHETALTIAFANTLPIP